jgi:hypothetical protein
MAVFSEKPPVTSSNCFENMKNASILMKLGTSVDWTIASVTAFSIINFLIPLQRVTSQNCEKSLFCFFSSKLISKCCNFSMDWDTVKGFSALVSSYPKIYLRPYCLPHVQNFLGDEGDCCPFKPPNLSERKTILRHYLLDSSIMFVKIMHYFHIIKKIIKDVPLDLMKSK